MFAEHPKALPAFVPRVSSAYFFRAAPRQSSHVPPPLIVGPHIQHAVIRINSQCYSTDCAARPTG
jgi:hypothetical protein